MAYSYRPPGGAGAGYGAYPNYHNPTPPPPGGHGAYYPPPAAQQHQHQPHYQPSPIHAPPSDPFRNFYASRLRELTFNSRQIIQDLSVTAMQQRDQGNWPNMQAIVEEIEAAVLRAPPQSKLPILYLIDSISKNVNQPYTTDLLPPIITRLYTRVYRDVDGVTKTKMEEMIALWRTSGPGRTDLYGPAVRDAIEREIFGSAGLNPAMLQARQAPLTRDVVLQKLQSTLEGKQRESAGKPWDPTVKHQIGVLQAIGDLLNSSQVPQSDLPKIMDQLRSMAPTAPAPPPPQAQLPMPAPTPMTAPTPTYPTFDPAAPPSGGLLAPNLPPFPPHAAAGNAYGGPPLSQNVTPVPSVSTPVPGQVPTPVASGIPANVADILRNLNASGLLSNPRTPETKPVPLKSAMDSYEEMILSMDVRLDALDLNRMSAPPVAHLPQRCKQCGIRFPEGEAKMQAHLDWHFRRNKSSTTASGRGAHRRWLPKAEEWVSDFASNAEAGPGPNSQSHGQRHGSPGGTVTASTGGASKLSAEQLARYALRKVPAPQDPVKAGRPCPICKEHWKAELEDDEWIWRNAIDIAGTIYHATCRAEQMNARKNAKLLNPNGRLSGSPRITPQLGESEVKAEPKASPMKVEAAQEATGSVDEQATGQGKRKADGGEESYDEVKRVKVEQADDVVTSQASPEDLDVQSASQPVTQGQTDGTMPGQLESTSQPTVQAGGPPDDSAAVAQTGPPGDFGADDGVDDEDEALYGTGTT